MTVHTIHACLNHSQADPAFKDCYCFDNDALGLIAEPLVSSASNAIAVACHCLAVGNEQQPVTPQQVQLRFSADGPQALQSSEHSTTSVWVELTLIGPKGDGHDYRMEFVLNPTNAEWVYAHNYDLQELWLCPVLLAYFPEGAPEFLYVEITPEG